MEAKNEDDKFVDDIYEVIEFIRHAIPRESWGECLSLAQAFLGLTKRRYEDAMIVLMN